MVLGLRTKSKRGTSTHVDYLVEIQDIKPWPPSQSLKSLRSVLLQWENGERSSGSTKSVVPSLADGKILFNESFRLPVTLSREVSVKVGDPDTFQKNCLEFNLYEPRRDKTVKGQLLGTVVVDLAEYGVLKETVVISSPMNCKRSFRNTALPILYIKLQPFDKRSSSSSSRESLSKEVSLEKDGTDSVSALMNGEYADEAEISSFTDDDISSHSSLTMSSSGIDATGNSPQIEEGSVVAVKESIGKVNDVPDIALDPVPAKLEVEPVIAAEKHLNGISSHPSSIDLSSGVGRPEDRQASFSNFLESSAPPNSLQSVTHSVHSSSIDLSSGVGRPKDHQASFSNFLESAPPNSLQSVTHSVHSSSLSLANDGTDEDSKCNDSKDIVQEAHEKITNGEVGSLQQTLNQNNTYFLQAEAADSSPQVDEKARLVSSANSQFSGNDDDKARRQIRMESVEAVSSNNIVHTDHLQEQDDRKGLGLTSNSLRQVKSVRSPMDLAKNDGLTNNNQVKGELKENDNLEEAHTGGRSLIHYERKETMSVSRETRTRASDNKIQLLENRIEKLERELREAAALEVSLYSIAAEHGSSANKVHAPARRLSRLYLHAWKQGSQARRASAARSAISGLVLVAKACGNDVPRLTFWLSNCVVLRAIIGSAFENLQLPVSAGPHIKSNGGGLGNVKNSSPLKWKDSIPSKKKNQIGFAKDVDDWEEPYTFTAALENIETWIFSRIVESVWWQTLTPHMQSASKANEPILSPNLRNSYRRKAILSDQEQANFSLERWKKAFKDACERLCPVRAAGHECGCLPILARLVMEQCVSRLDVALFNAILRESADEIPTDPVSDPVSDSNVLPIPAGKSNFGAGAQLKNTIGNWSRWLSDLFDIDDDACYEHENEIDDDARQEHETSSKSFRLLNALSDLMMLPKDMLLNKSIRTEVCPTFGAPLIKTILNNFTSDEFCPDPIPEEVFEALDTEEDREECISTFPCNAAPVIYSPPSTALLASFIGEVGKESHLRRSRSLVLRKSYTSDDELDELDSPLNSIIDSFHAASTPSWKQKENRSHKVVRYQLLQEVWRDGN